MKYFTLLCVFSLLSVTVGFDLYPMLVSRHRRSLQSSLRTMYNNALQVGQNLYRTAQAQVAAARNLQRNQLQNPTANTFFQQSADPYDNGARRQISSGYGTASRQNFRQNTDGRIQGWQSVSINPGNGGWQTVSLGYRYGPKVTISGPTGIINDPRINVPNGIINRPVDPRINRPNNIINRPIDPRVNGPNPIINGPMDPRFGNTPVNNLGRDIPIIPTENPFIPVNTGGIVLGPQPIALGLTQNAPVDPITGLPNDPLVFTHQADKWFWGGDLQTGPLRGAVPPHNDDSDDQGVVIPGQS